MKNLNDGFDAIPIKYFSEEDFEIILNRIKEFKLGVLGIEPWKNREYFCVLTYESVTNDPTDYNWYMSAFETLKERDADLLYSATYYIPDKFL